MRFSHIFVATYLCVLPFSAVYAQEAEEFTDVPVSHPNYTAITELRDDGVISGYEDGSFKPERTVTRAEIVKIVLLALGIDPVSGGSSQFSDVESDEWYTQYIITANQRGIVGGYPDGTFQPDRTVSRVEGLKILLNAKGVTLPEAEQQIFSDVPISEWYAPYVQYVVDHELLEIPGGEFKVDEGLRRKDIAQILYAMEVEERAMQLSSMPIVPLLITFVLWFVPGLVNLWYVRKKHELRPTWQRVLVVIGGPVASIMLALLHMQKPEPVHKEELDAKQHTLEFSRRRYTYFRRPREIKKEFLAWFDANRMVVSCILLSGILLYFVTLSVATSVQTYYYKQAFLSEESTQQSL